MALKTLKNVPNCTLYIIILLGNLCDQDSLFGPNGVRNREVPLYYTQFSFCIYLLCIIIHTDDSPMHSPPPVDTVDAGVTSYSYDNPIQGI